MESFSSFIAEARRTKIRQDSKTGDEDGVNTKNDAVGTASITDERRVRVQKEGMTSTIALARATPVTMSSTPRNKATNAPSSAASLQRSADSRRQKLDTFAQKQKDLQTKNRETQLRSREQKSNQNASNN